MKISRKKFEEEFDALICAAQSSSEETAKAFIQQAYNKLEGYDNIPFDLRQECYQKIASLERKLND